MVKFRLKTFVNSHTLLALLLCYSCSLASADEDTTPERSIRVIHSELQTPQWKYLWDTARRLALIEKFPESARAYAELFTLKPKIEEANWEYCKVLLQTKDYEAVARVVEALLELNPARPEYQLVAGRVALHNKDFAGAVRNFGRVLEKDPAGEQSSAAMEGLVDSLRGQGQNQLAFALEEHLFARNQNPSPEAVLTMAMDGALLGEKDKARWLYLQLLEQNNFDDRLLYQAAQVFDEPGYEDTLYALLTQYLNSKPAYLPFRLRLAELQQERGEYLGALENISYAVDHIEDNGELLLRAASLSFDKLQRPDKALLYYGRYNQKYPGDPKIESQILELESVLAKDFLVIVENEGAELLWNDLELLASHRLAIFYDIADELEHQEKEQELLDVLEIILLNSPENGAIALRLAQLYHRQGDYQQSLNSLHRVDDVAYSKDYFQLRAEVELLLGFEHQALQSMAAALEIDPADASLRSSCIKVSGNLGLVQQQIDFFDYWVASGIRDLPVEFVISHIQLLGENYLLNKARDVSDWAEHYFSGSDKDLVQLGVAEARVLQRVGKSRRSAQTLRTLLNRELFTDLLLFELGRNAVADNRLSEARQWLDILQKDSFSGSRFYTAEQFQIHLFLTQASLLRGQGLYNKAYGLLKKGVQALSVLPLEPASRQFLQLHLSKESCELNIAADSSLAESDPCLDTDIGQQFDPQLYVIQNIASRSGRSGSSGSNSEAPGATSEPLFIGGQPILSRILAVAEQEFRYKQYRQARNRLGVVQGHIEDSVHARLLSAELLVEKKKILEGGKELGQLQQQFPGEYYLCKQRIGLQATTGNYQDAIKLLLQCYGGSENIEQLAKHLLTKEEIEGAVRLARLLWSNSQHLEALEIYQQLLTPPLSEILSEQFREKNITSVGHGTSLWGSLVSLLHSKPDLVDTLMEPQFLVDNLGSEKGRIVAANYERYSWFTLITTEFKTREATYNHNYRFTDSSNRQLFQDRGSVELLSDLASIYE